jgi:hypothetical protein
MDADNYGRLRVSFRFVRKQDVETYGRADGEPWVYDEAVLFELPAQQLVALEKAMGGYSVLDLAADFRDDRIIARHAASWLAIHFEAPEVAGPYETYAPAVMMMNWDFGAQDGEEPVPLDSGESASSPPEG